MTDTQELKHAVILSGGGADGAYEVGVMKALFSGKAPFTRGPVEPEIFTGTSIGAFNAALLVSRWEQHGSAAISDLERTWLDTLADRPGRVGHGGFRYRLSPLDYFNPNYYFPNPFVPLLQFARDSLFIGWDGLRRLVGLVQSTSPIADRLLSLFDLTTLVSRDPLSQTVQETIQLESIRRSHKSLMIAATNWDSGELTIFRNYNMTEYLGPQAILASAAIPGFFPPTAVGAQPFVDGGVVMNTPLLPAIDEGADILHVIYMDPDVSNIPQVDLQNTLQTMYRMQVIGWARLINHEIEHDKTLNGAIKLLGEIDPGAAKRIEDGFLTTDPDSKFAHRLRRPPGHREVTIHRYHPSENLGGLLGFLDTRYDRIARLIEQGFTDAVFHDCTKSQCVIRSQDQPAAGGESVHQARPEGVIPAPSLH